MIEFVFIILLGVFTGVMTGLIPGIHPNTVVFSLIPLYFAFNLDFLLFICLVAGMSVAHTFHDFIPAIFLGAPEGETALSALPGRRLALEGRGIEAFRYTVAGGFYSVTVFVVLAPLLFLFLERFYVFLEPVMQYLLLFFLLTVVLESGGMVSSVVTACLSAALGILSFSIPVNSQYVLLPVFSGLFAVPALVAAFRSPGTVDISGEGFVRHGRAFRGGVSGFFAGLIAGIFPGLGAAVSTTFLSPFLKDSEQEFLAAMGGVNTTDILVSFVALYLIGKARSGASVALQAISSVGSHQVFFTMGASLFAVSVAVPVAYRIPVYLKESGANIPVKWLAAAAALTVVCVTFFLTGLLGILVLSTASVIGFSAFISGQRRPCMAVLIVPSILFFAGVDIFM